MHCCAVEKQACSSNYHCCGRRKCNHVEDDYSDNDDDVDNELINLVLEKLATHLAQVIGEYVSNHDDYMMSFVPKTDDAENVTAYAVTAQKKNSLKIYQ